MKKSMFIILAMVCFMCISMPVFANSECFTVVVPPADHNYNANYNNNENNVTTRILNSNEQNQKQRQSQVSLQGQTQSMINGQNIAPVQNVNIVNPSDISIRELTSPDVRPMDIPVFQNGELSNWNDYQEIPIEGVTYLKKGEVVTKVLKVIKGFPWWRVRSEDVLSKIIDNKISGNNVRYFVIKKGAVTGLGFSLGGAATAPMGDGLVTGSAPFGFTSSARDDEFYITFVQVK